VEDFKRHQLDTHIYGDGLCLGPEGIELEGLHFCRVAFPSCKSLAVSKKPLQLIDSKMVARDGIEPPTPAFQGPLPMDLSRLESADPIETKDVNAVPI
jgi:hypothetical protein